MRSSAIELLLRSDVVIPDELGELIDAGETGDIDILCIRPIPLRLPEGAR